MTAVSGTAITGSTTLQCCRGEVSVVPVARVESALVDLSAVSLLVLRASADPVLKRSKMRVLREAGNPWFEVLKMQSASGGGGC